MRPGPHILALLAATLTLALPSHDADAAPDAPASVVPATAPNSPSASPGPEPATRPGGDPTNTPANAATVPSGSITLAGEMPELTPAASAIEPARVLRAASSNCLGISRDGSFLVVVTDHEEINLFRAAAHLWPELALVIASLVALAVTARRYRRRWRPAWVRQYALGEPYCAKCRYQLTGTTSPACPECGADLSRPRAVYVGAPSRVPSLVLGACLALLLAIAFAVSAEYMPIDRDRPGWEYASSMRAFDGVVIPWRHSFNESLGERWRPLLTRSKMIRRELERIDINTGDVTWHETEFRRHFDSIYFEPTPDREHAQYFWHPASQLVTRSHPASGFNDVFDVAAGNKARRIDWPSRTTSSDDTGFQGFVYNKKDENTLFLNIFGGTYYEILPDTGEVRPSQVIVAPTPGVSLYASIFWDSNAAAWRNWPFPSSPGKVADKWLALTVASNETRTESPIGPTFWTLAATPIDPQPLATLGDIVARPIVMCHGHTPWLLEGDTILVDVSYRHDVRAPTTPDIRLFDVRRWRWRGEGFALPHADDGLGPSSAQSPRITNARILSMELSGDGRWLLVEYYDKSDASGSPTYLTIYDVKSLNPRGDADPP